MADISGSLMWQLAVTVSVAAFCGTDYWLLTVASSCGYLCGYLQGQFAVAGSCGKLQWLKATIRGRKPKQFVIATGIKYLHRKGGCGSLLLQLLAACRGRYLWK